MIQANELRVGNIYNRKHGKGWTQIVMDEYIIGNIFGTGSTYALDDFEAIPLTATEMYDLEFNIFHENPRLEKFWVNNQGYYPIIIQQTRNLDFYFQENTPLPYLHQLQNLYRDLTGNELIYKP